MQSKDGYEHFLRFDLIYFLVMALVTDMDDAKNQVNMIMDSWGKRNKKLIHKAFEENMRIAEEKLIEEELPVELDEVGLLMSVKEMAFNSIREGLIESTKEAIFKSIDKNYSK